MANSFPGSVKTFSTKSTGDTIQASHVTDLQDEVTAVETILLNGPLTMGNSTVNTVFTNTSVTISNSTVNTAHTSAGLTVGANVTVNATTVFVGNSTVNTAHTSAGLTVGANVTVNATTVFVGNSSVNTAITGTGITSTGNLTIGGDTSASSLKFLEPSGSGNNYTAFKAQAQSADVTYILPAADGSSGQVLSTNGSATLSWQTVALTQTFRGLNLRTHPDSDSRKSKVMLVHADEIVFDGGRRITSGLDRLVMDITTSGAGGLDTGSEGASRWYEIYAILKDTDLSVALLAHRAKDYLLDQSHTTVTNVIGVRDASARTKVGQTYTPATTGPRPFFDVRIEKNGSPTGNLWLSLYATSSGAPTGAAVATSDKLDVSLISTTPGYIRFVFRNPSTLTASTVYALVMEGDFTIDGTNYINWSYNAGGGYGSGSRYDYNGTTWSASSGNDMTFKDYVTENDTAVTMPSGYTEKALIGHVYNNSGSDFIEFVQQGRLVLRTYLTVASNITSNIPILTDLSAAVPPVPLVEVIYDLDNTGAGTARAQFRLSASNLEVASLYWTFGSNGGRGNIGNCLSEFQMHYLSGSVGAYFYLVGYRW